MAAPSQDHQAPAGIGTGIGKLQTHTSESGTHQVQQQLDAELMSYLNPMTSQSPLELWVALEQLGIKLASENYDVAG